MTSDLQALLALLPELERQYDYHVNDLGNDYIEAPVKATTFKIIIAGIKSMADVTHIWVPREPTETMKVNGGLAFENAAFGECKLVFEAAGDAYRAMLSAVAAAPSPAINDPYEKNHDIPDIL